MDGSFLLTLLWMCSARGLSVSASSEENDTHKDSPSTYLDFAQNKIAMAQYECYQKIMKDQNHGRTGSVCNRTWDGWLCWDDTEAGFTTEQHCPDYYHNFDTREMASKVCSETGQWGLHPTSNRTWTNYTQCFGHTVEGNITALNHLYLVLIGQGLSLASLFISLGIFFHFKSLSCQRITLHKNLFFSLVLNSVITIIWLTAVVKNKDLVQSNPVSCKVIMFIHLYVFGCNYFWMLCEGIYLHTLIVVAVFAEKQHLVWYYLLGWGFPVIPALIHAVARGCYYNDNCWLSSNTTLLYIVHGPICAALLVNLFFLLNIVRVLITKLKVTRQAEFSLYMKAVRATLILVPLLGIQFVMFPYKPEGRFSSEIHGYVMHILLNFQGLLVATIFCFFNGEVQSVLRRHWKQQRMQFSGPFAHADVLRSASYVASSLTEVHRCYSIDGHTEHMNGKGYHDIETTAIHRTDSAFA